jgi:PAS domain S-box-containing protein
MKHLRVLFVEDSPEDAELIASELENGGYCLDLRKRVQTREGLRAALEQGGWDLVMGDFSLPGFTGLEALKLVREFSPDLPFLMISGTVGEELAVAAMKAGANDFLVKGKLQRLAPAVARELRERKVREEKEASQKALALTRFSLDHSSELMLWLREDGRIMLANDTACGALGYSRDELLAMSYWDIDPAFPKEKFSLQWREVRRLTTCTLESTIACKSGARIEAEMACNYVFFGGEECVLVMLRDVTEKRKAEAALRSSEEQLRQAQRMESVGRLAGGIAHDFNNILSVVSGYASLLQMKVARNGIAHKELIEIEKAVMRATSLVRQLLTFSRKQMIQPQVIDLSSVLRESLSMLQMVLGEDVVVETRIGSDLGKIMADRSQMEQIILNLAINARDAMPKGGSLLLALTPVKLEAGDLQEGEKAAPGRYIGLAVKDNGLGMDRATLLRIFEPFFTTKAEGHGTGLGLATVYGIVKQAGGLIRVESEPGSGTTFFIYLPCCSETGETEAIASLEPSSVRTKGESILLVEDDSALRKLTKDVLVMEGYKVLETRNVDEAIGFAKAREMHIDLLLTDLIMPHMNGKELADAVLVHRPLLRVLFMSGYAPETLLPHTGWLSESNFLEKPFATGKLLAKIRGVLESPVKADKPAANKPAG